LQGPGAPGEFPAGDHGTVAHLPGLH
jgi:hypothetical protein